MHASVRDFRILSSRSQVDPADGGGVSFGRTGFLLEVRIYIQDMTTKEWKC